MLLFFGLGIIDPANEILQKRDVGFPKASLIIDATLENIKRFRSDENFDRFCQTVETIISTNGITPRIRRAPRRSSRLRDSIVMSTIGQSESGNETPQLKAMFFEIIDRICNEMEARFNNNSSILNAISSANDLSRNKLLPLLELGVKLPSESELSVVKTFLDKEKEKPEQQNSSILQMLTPVKDAFITTFDLFEAIETFGSSTSVNECAFSAVSRIDTVKRMSMNSQRLCDLCFLSFEKAKLSSLDTKLIIQKFGEKNRRVQLH